MYLITILNTFCQVNDTEMSLDNAERLKQVRNQKLKIYNYIPICNLFNNFK